MSRFPVSLFVNKASLPEVDEKVLYGVVNNVFLDWSKVGGGIASYRITEERSKADIIIEWEWIIEEC